MIGHIFIILPILYKFYGRKIIRKMIPQSTNNYCLYRRITRTLVLTLLLLLPNFITRLMNCDKISFGALGASFIDGSISSAVGRLLGILITFIPILRIFLFFLGEQIQLGAWILGYVISHFIIFGIQSSLSADNYCKPDFTGKNGVEKFFFVIFIILIIVDIMHSG